MVTVAAASVDLAANSAAFQRDMDKAANAARSFTARTNRVLATFDRGFGRARSSIAGVVRQMTSFRAVLGALTGAAGVGLLVKQSLDYADAIAKTADRVGLSTRALQEYRFAFALAGVEQDRFNTGVEAFGKRLGEARAGTGALVTLLKKTDEAFLAQLTSVETTDEAFRLYIEKLASVENASDRAALSAAAFSRSAGIEMANGVKNGVAEIDRLRARANELGLVLSEETLRGAEKAKDELFVLGQVIKVNVIGAVADLAPEIGDLASRFTEALPALVDYVEAFGKWVGLIKETDLEKLQRIGEEINVAQAANSSRFGGIDMAGNGPFARELRKRLQEQSALTFRQFAAPEDLSVITGAASAARGTAGGGGSVAGSAAGSASDILGGDLLSDGPPLPGRKPMVPEVAALIDKLGAMDNELESIAGNLGAVERDSLRVWQDTRTPLEEYEATVERLNTLLEANRESMGKAGIDAETYGRAVEQAQDQLKAASAETDNFSRASQAVGREVTGAFTDIATEGKKLGDVLRDLARSMVTSLGTSLVQTGANALAGRLLGSALPGFASGGSFTVGGQGGVDQNLVAFRATRGERVTVETPGQQRAGGGVGVTMNFSMGVRTEARAELLSMLPEIERRMTRSVATQMTRNGRMLSAQGR